MCKIVLDKSLLDLLREIKHAKILGIEKLDPRDPRILDEEITEINCVVCYEFFDFTQSDARWFKMKDLDVPKRCKRCRENNKIRELFGKSTQN